MIDDDKLLFITKVSFADRRQTPKQQATSSIKMEYLKVKYSKNIHVVLAPSFCGENCFRVIRDLSDCISFPDERNESLFVNY